MQLLVITIDNCDEFLATLEGLKAHGMNGIVFQSTSLKNALLNSNVDAAPIFGSISKVIPLSWSLPRSRRFMRSALYAATRRALARKALCSPCRYPHMKE